jgi:hypothetical protein
MGLVAVRLTNFNDCNSASDCYPTGDYYSDIDTTTAKSKPGNADPVSPADSDGEGVEDANSNAEYSDSNKR